MFNQKQKPITHGSIPNKVYSPNITSLAHRILQKLSFNFINFVTPFHQNCVLKFCKLVQHCQMLCKRQTQKSWLWSDLTEFTVKYKFDFVLVRINFFDHLLLFELILFRPYCPIIRILHCLPNIKDERRSVQRNAYIKKSKNIRRRKNSSI